MSQTIDEQIEQCFRDTYMETQGDTELFDIEETKVAIKSLIIDTLRSIELPEQETSPSANRSAINQTEYIADIHAIGFNEALEACKQAINAKIKEVEA